MATRISGWGSNRLSNLGCHEGSSVDQKNMVTLPRFDGNRVCYLFNSMNIDYFLGNCFLRGSQSLSFSY